MDERNRPTAKPVETSLFVDDRSPDATWSPSPLVTEEERWRAGLDRDVRPLVERCKRLRDRGLLD